MSNFNLVKLDDLVQRVKVGFVGQINDFYCDKEDGVPLIRTTDLNESGIDYSNLKYVTKEFHKKNKKSQIKKGDVLIARHGDNGKASVFREDFDAQVLNAVIIEPNQDLLSSELIKIFFETPFVRKQILGAVKGSVQGVINTSHVANLLIPLNQEINYQQVSKLISSLDRKIELNARINAELESMAKTLYDYWFVQFEFPTPLSAPLSFGHPPKYDMETLGNTESQSVVFGGTEGGYKSAGGKMVWNEALKREIPLGWEVGSLGDFVDIFDSKRIPLSSSQRAKMQGQYPYYGATSIMDYVNDFIFDGEYLLIAEDGSVMGDDGLAIVQYIWGKTWVNNHAHVLLPKEPSNKDYLYFLLKSISVVQIMTGSIQKKITQDNLLGVPFVLPDKETLKLFSEFARPIRKRMINIFEESQTLTELRDWLLPMLMNGQVAVG